MTWLIWALVTNFLEMIVNFLLGISKVAQVDVRFIDLFAEDIMLVLAINIVTLEVFFVKF